ncbi:MAG: hypothetical protein HC774_06380 [Sphingomonadales bacterium]|nr:hypothetical protein [Sphingomonadales bacterium]
MRARRFLGQPDTSERRVGEDGGRDAVVIHGTGRCAAEQHVGAAAAEAIPELVQAFDSTDDDLSSAAIRAPWRLAFASTFALGKAFCFYYSAVHQGHVPQAAELRRYYQEQVALAEKAWKKHAEMPILRRSFTSLDPSRVPA